MSEQRWPAEPLVLAAQAGDPSAIAALVSGSHPHVQRFARTLCATPEDAEDAAQEALIILYRKVGSLRATSALASWMFQIVRRECLRRIRRTPLVLDASTEIVATSAEEHVLLRLEADRVAAAIAALPAELRRVLIMRDVQGYPGRVVAQALGLSVAAMKSRLHRARATVHAVLADPDPITGRDPD